ncbi:hypothetical protein TcasGA2_TC034610, partial [Tribolium castaneum]
IKNKIAYFGLVS